MAKLTGKKAVITGGTSGLGFATAKLFIEEGAQVAITGRSEERLRQAADQLGDGVLTVRADVRENDDLSVLADRIQQRFGKIDALFANAGVGMFAPLEAIDAEHFDTQFDINVRGALFTIQKLSGSLEDGASVILNASAIHEKGVAGSAVYSATKAAVRSIARSLAAELAPRKIRVNSLSPGLVLTDFQKNMGVPDEQLEGFYDYIKKAAPLGRTGEPHEIAQAALFLASDAASYITGADLTVDGGYMNV